MKIERIISEDYIFCANNDCEHLPEYTSIWHFGHTIKRGTTCIRFYYYIKSTNSDYMFYICGGCIDSVFKNIKLVMDPNIRAFT